MSLHMLGAAPLSPGGGTVASVTVSPEAPTVEMGTQQRFAAVATDASGSAFTPPVVSWTASGGGTIDPSGLFTPTVPGPCVVTARVGTVIGRTTVTVTEPPRGLSSSDEDDGDLDFVAETKPDLVFPRQGFPSFRASPMEIDPQPRVRRGMVSHYPDLRDLERRPWGVRAPEDAAFDWAGVTPAAEQEWEEGSEWGGVGQLPGALPGAFAVPPAVAPPAPPAPPAGGAVVHHHGHDQHHGGGFWPWWGWGAPWVNVAEEIDDDGTLDADAIADLVAEKIERRRFAREGTTAVGDITDTKTDYDRGEQLCLYMNQVFTALGRPKEFEAQAQAVWKEYQDAKAGVWWTMTEKFLNATKMKNAGIDAAKLVEDMKRAYPEKMAAAAQTNVPKPSTSFLGRFAFPWWGYAAIAAGVLGVVGYFAVPAVLAALARRATVRGVLALARR